VEELYDYLESTQEWIEHYDRMARGPGVTGAEIEQFGHESAGWEREYWRVRGIIKAISGALNGGPDAMTDWEIREAMEASL
jgi:hypothetical protein